MGLASLFLRAEEGKLLPSAGCFLGNSGASKLVLRWAEKLLSSLTDAKAGGGLHNVILMGSGGSWSQGFLRWRVGTCVRLSWRMVPNVEGGCGGSGNQ